ncbi:copper resistance CopC/CopD family protein [Geodermatophilus sp. CPCC 205761]|uniref:copper resistance CopC/CopD family protein n=1 Tax=Geodermatophilus sp. CPCC 205761 TaxID=2936597 RepID=UPI003F53D481
MSRRTAWPLLLLLLGAWLVAGVGTASPAAAHAELVSTDPGEGARLEQAPAEVTLTFTEGVSLGAGYARVLDAAGERVDAGTATVEGAAVVIPLRSDLGDDGYLVTYRVVSADSHPISGAFSFVVGDGELVPAGTAGDGADTDPVVASLLPAARWLGYAGLALGVGVPVLLVVGWPAGWRSPRLHRLVAGGLVAVAAGAVLTFVLQGPYAAGSGLGSVADPTLLGATASTGNGATLLLRAALAVALLLELRPAWRRGEAPRPYPLAVAGVLALALVLATAAVGHPVAGPWPALAVVAATVHTAAMAVWLGGLVGLLAGVLREDAPADELARVLPPFSRLAAGSVTALVVSGVVQAVREVGAPTTLVTTTYGWVLVAKLALVLLLLAAAGISRVWVQQHLGLTRPRPAGHRRVTAHAFAAGAGPAEDPAVESAAGARAEVQAAAAGAERPALRRSVLAEFVLALVVLGLSSVLVGTPPARAAVAQPVDVTEPLETATGTEGSVQISVDPATAGPNTLHVYYFDEAGQLAQPLDIRVSVTEPAQEIGPIEVGLEPAGPGHYVGDGMAVPGPGTWTLAVTVRVDEFTASTASTTFPVR